jgi:hypothetical protein
MVVEIRDGQHGQRRGALRAASMTLINSAVRTPNGYVDLLPAGNYCASA